MAARGRFGELVRQGVGREEAAGRATHELKPQLDAWSTLLTAAGLGADEERARRDYANSPRAHQDRIDAAMGRDGILSVYMRHPEQITELIESMPPSGPSHAGGGCRNARRRRKGHRRRRTVGVRRRAKRRLSTVRRTRSR